MEILNNLRKAREVLEKAPESSIHLSFFKKVEPCGTLFCSVGWLAQDKYFQVRGVELVQSNANPAVFLLPKYKNDNDEFEIQHAWLDELFGPQAYDRLFHIYANGIYDEELMPEAFEDGYWKVGKGKPISDKALAIARIDRQIMEIENAAAN